MNAHLTETLGSYFEKHGKNIYGSPSPLNSSPLYAHLSLHIATDPAILLLVAEADRTTTITNLLFGAVHFLLLSDVQHPLSEFYPDLTPDPRPLTALCLYHSYTLNQMPRAVREQILQHVADFSQQRDLYRISQEGWSIQGKPELELYAYRKGEVQKTLLAYCESHGRWIEWQYAE